MKQIILTVTLFAFWLVPTSGHASSDSQGVQVKVVTSTGIVQVVTGTDTVEHFGEEIDARDLIQIVRHRNKNMKGKLEVSYKHKRTRQEDKVMCAAYLLGQAKEPRAFPHLIALLDDPFLGMRGYAVMALEKCGDRRALPALLKVLKQGKPCSGFLAPAIGRLGDDTAVPILIDTIPAGGTMDVGRRLKAIEQITGLSLSAIREEWGLVYYGEKHRQFLKAMHVWWEENKAKSRNGKTVEQGAPADAGSGSVPPVSTRHVADAPHVASTAGDHADGSELTIYKKLTSIGTVAKRMFRDSNGRVSKTIYYRSTSPSLTGPYPEESLRVQSIILHKYDEQGREQREEHHGPDMTLRRIRDTLYRDGDKTIVWRRPDETREYEIRYSGNRSISHLHFDHSGQKLVSVRGAIPSDIDLAWGWGRPLEGLVCGIGANRTSGRLKEFRIYVTIHNLTEARAKVVTAIQYHVVQMELRDAKGATVPQNSGYIAKRKRYLIRANRGPNENIQTIPTREAAVYTGGYELQEWYSRLPGGTYYLTVRRRAAGKDFSLVSNKLELEIQDEN